MTIVLNKECRYKLGAGDPGAKKVVTKEKVVATVSTEITELVKRYEGELSVLKIQNSLLQNELAQMKV